MKRVIGVSAILVLASQAMAWPEKSPDSAKQTTVSLQSAVALARVVDKAVAAKCQESGIALSPQTTDAEFLRRVHLDLVGHIPTLERTRSFLASTEPDKRAKLVDRGVCRLAG